MRKFNPEKELNKIQNKNKNKIILGVIILLIIVGISSSYALYQVKYSKRIIYSKVAPFNDKDLILSVYVDGKKQNNVPSKDDGYVFEYIECDSNSDNNYASWDDETWKLISSFSIPNKCDIYFTKKTQEQIVKDFAYNGDMQEYIVPQSGTYQIELWGAAGGDNVFLGGKGAYTRGLINLTKDERLYFYVGSSGNNGGYNGGTAVIGQDWGGDIYGAAGGGATDVRVVSGSWDDFNSLKSRIMVAAGGGGANNRGVNVGGGAGGAGGTLTGVNGIHSTSESIYSYGTGGTQTKGGDRIDVGTDNYGYSGTFGAGGAGQTSGGGGYYGGGSSSGAGGGGGSSFISGHPGCKAIDNTQSTSIDNIVHTDSPNHYSNKIFTATLMVAGNEIMKNYSDNLLERGNSGDGYARITFIK